jgi:hypothetical protein
MEELFIPARSVILLSDNKAFVDNDNQEIIMKDATHWENM